MKTAQLIQEYYEAFNNREPEKMLSFLVEDIVHDINQGDRETGKEAFSRFLSHMDVAYSETLTDIAIMVDSTGQRAAAEFTVNGIYLQADEGFPKAHGQKYVIPAGAFFEVDTNTSKIKRVTTYYNLPGWIAAVSE